MFENDRQLKSIMSGEDAQKVNHFGLDFLERELKKRTPPILTDYEATIKNDPFLSKQNFNLVRLPFWIEQEKNKTLSRLDSSFFDIFKTSLYSGINNRTYDGITLDDELAFNAFYSLSFLAMNGYFGDLDSSQVLDSFPACKDLIEKHYDYIYRESMKINSNSEKSVESSSKTM